VWLDGSQLVADIRAVAPVGAFRPLRPFFGQLSSPKRCPVEKHRPRLIHGHNCGRLFRSRDRRRQELSHAICGKPVGKRARNTRCTRHLLRFHRFALIQGTRRLAAKRVAHSPQRVFESADLRAESSCVRNLRFWRGCMPPTRRVSLPNARESRSGTHDLSGSPVWRPRGGAPPDGRPSSRPSLRTTSTAGDGIGR
jgi:hypothetical protein